MRITGTFLDEITHDIPALNWDESDWDRDFAAMRKIGIDKVILIRCDHMKYAAYPSEVLRRAEGALTPPTDLVEMFLRLAEKHQLKFYFGTYYSGRDWLGAAYDPNYESDLMNAVCDEFYERYGKHSSAFGGWYLSQEINVAASFNVVKCYKQVGKHCRELADVPILISPGINGVKNRREALPYGSRKRLSMTLSEFRDDWEWIYSEISGVVDVAAFQDGHVEIWELPEFLAVNKELADKYGVELWTNAETFDRDIPGWMPPIKWEKLYYKLEAARNAGITNGITFDFSHFLSPNSCYPSAAKLLRNYCRWANINQEQEI